MSNTCSVSAARPTLTEGKSTLLSLLQGSRMCSGVSYHSQINTWSVVLWDGEQH